MKEEKLRKIILCKGPEAEGSTEYASRREEKKGGWSHMDIWGRTFRQKETACAKALGQEPVCYVR